MKTADTNWQNLKKVCAHLLEFITTASFHEVNICCSNLLHTWLFYCEFLQAFNLYPANDVKTYDQLKQYQKVIAMSGICKL